jgi:acyl-CoA synthetase (AMP-forming)/AMP-acid ligase II
VATPIYHGFGMAALVLSVVLGVKIQIMPRFNAEKAVFLIKKHKITLITLVPSMLYKLLDESKNNLESLRCIVSGGAPLPLNLIKTVLQNPDYQLFNLYGTSEAGFCILAQADDLKKHPTTIGRPIIGVKTLILNDKNEQVLENEMGRLCLKTRWSIIEKSTQNGLDKNWVETGDLAYKNAENYYFLCGRTDEMMVVGGENVYPITIENVLLEHPAIAQAVVVAQNDTTAGQRPKAFVLLAEGMTLADEHTPTEADLIDFLKKRLARFQIPQNIVFVTFFHCTEIGKIDKRKLS